MPRKTNDPLAAITTAIRAKLKDRQRNLLEIGELLLKAKERLDHGEWLPWLEDNFALDPRTAQNYMATARWVDAHEEIKNETLSHLESRLLYVLAANDSDSEGEWSADDVAAVLEEAKARPVSLRRAYEIVGELQEAEREEDAAAKAVTTASLLAAWERDRAAAAAAYAAQAEEDNAAKAEEDAEIAAILDGPPPVLPPPPTPGAEDQRLQSETENIDAADFKDALAALFRVHTRVHVEEMASVVESSTLRAVTEFLNAVVATATRKAA